MVSIPLYLVDLTNMYCLYNTVTPYVLYISATFFSQSSSGVLYRSSKQVKSYYLGGLSNNTKCIYYYNIIIILIIFNIVSIISSQ